MRVNIVHQIVFLGLLVAGMLVVPYRPDGRLTPVSLVAGVAAGVAFAGPILRWLCVWPLIPRCPRCGVWVNGFYRATGPDGILVISAVCGHAFVMRGRWAQPLLRDKSRMARKLIEEMGWAVWEDGRVFRFAFDYTTTLLDEDGEAIGRRRARWPYWVVRWTAE